jgi:hypothetical protein
MSFDDGEYVVFGRESEVGRIKSKDYDGYYVEFYMSSGAIIKASHLRRATNKEKKVFLEQAMQRLTSKMKKTQADLNEVRNQFYLLNFAEPNAKNLNKSLNESFDLDALSS